MIPASLAADLDASGLCYCPVVIVAIHEYGHYIVGRNGLVSMPRRRSLSGSGGLLL